MFGSIGGAELLLIMVLALLLFGPRRLPQIGKSIGRALSEFRSASNEFKSSLEREVEIEQLRETRAGLRGAAAEAAEAVREVERVARGSIVDPSAGELDDPDGAAPSEDRPRTGAPPPDGSKA